MEPKNIYVCRPEDSAGKRDVFWTAFLRSTLTCSKMSCKGLKAPKATPLSGSSEIGVPEGLPEGIWF